MCSATAPPNPILGKPKAVRSSTDSSKMILSWEVPAYFDEIDGLSYSVEMCESGNDWRRIRANIK